MEQINPIGRPAFERPLSTTSSTPESRQQMYSSMVSAGALRCPLRRIAAVLDVLRKSNSGKPASQGKLKGTRGNVTEDGPQHRLVHVAPGAQASRLAAAAASRSLPPALQALVDSGEVAWVGGARPRPRGTALGCAGFSAGSGRGRGSGRMHSMEELEPLAPPDTESARGGRERDAAHAGGAAAALGQLGYAMPPLRLVELFAGIGGFRHGAESAMRR